MAYRKITVDGKVYEYSIGKSHTKIKGIGVFKNEDIGKRFTIEDHQYCDCCGESLEDLYGIPPNVRTEVAVRPYDIMKKIHVPTPRRYI